MIAGGILSPKSMKGKQFWLKMEKYQNNRMQMAKKKLIGYQYYEDRIFPFQYVP